MARLSPIPVDKLIAKRTMHIRFTGLGRFRLRLWLGRCLLRVVSLVMPLRCEIDEEEPSGEGQEQQGD